MGIPFRVADLVFLRFFLEQSFERFGRLVLEFFAFFLYFLFGFGFYLFFGFFGSFLGF